MGQRIKQIKWPRSWTPWRTQDNGRRMKSFLVSLQLLYLFYDFTSTILFCRKVILIAIQDEGAARMTRALQSAVVRVGGRNPVRPAYRGSYALVGYSGPERPSWIMQVTKPRYRGPSQITTVISTGSGPQTPRPTPPSPRPPVGKSRLFVRGRDDNGDDDGGVTMVMRYWW